MPTHNPSQHEWPQTRKKTNDPANLERLVLSSWAGGRPVFLGLFQDAYMRIYVPRLCSWWLRGSNFRPSEDSGTWYMCIDIHGWNLAKFIQTSYLQLSTYTAMEERSYECCPMSKGCCLCHGRAVHATILLPQYNLQSVNLPEIKIIPKEWYHLLEHHHKCKDSCI